MKLINSVAFRSGLLFFTLLFIGQASLSYAAEEGAGTARRVRMRLEYNSRLTIAKMPPFPYDGRDADSVGTMIEKGDGIAELFFPASSSGAPPLPMIPGRAGIPLRVEIMPRDMAGTIDFCSGEVTLRFDASFEPNAFGIRSSPLSVATDLTTGTSKGSFREVKGRPLDAKGDCLLVGVARVPKTKDFLVNRFLSLPTDAVSEMEAHFDFPDGRPVCPGAAAEQPGERVFLGVDKNGRLSISSFPAFKYDGKGSGGFGSIESMEDGRARVYFSGHDLAIPALQMIPGSNLLRVEIETKGLAGEIDLETGRIELDFDAAFTPCLGKIKQTPISVVTSLTTETSKGMKKELAGERLDEFGDAFFVGVAVVPKTDGAFINMLLGLPADAACELPVHFDFIPEETDSGCENQ